MTDQRIENRRLSLSGQVMIGLVLGIAVIGLVLGVAVGIFFGEMVSWLKLIGDIFIKLLQMVAAFCFWCGQSPLLSSC
jgi:L-cystine uptake protein TcyP (sodium:dicarboxylate symporter family)